MKMKNCIFLLIAFVSIGLISTEATQSKSEHVNTNGEREPRGNLIQFKRFGQNVAVGFDFILPFIKVATQTKRDELGNTEPLVSINTASMLLTGILAGGGMFVAHIFRTMGLQQKDYSITQKADSHEKRYDSDTEESKLMQMLENFKLVYRNTTGHRIETTLPRLFEKIEESFIENDINLPVCLQKALCSLVQKATATTRIDAATSIEKIIDGLSSSTWLINTLATPIIRDSIETGKYSNGSECLAKYLQCKWDAPAENLMELITNNIKFA